MFQVHHLGDLGVLLHNILAIGRGELNISAGKPNQTRTLLMRLHYSKG